MLNKAQFAANAEGIGTTWSANWGSPEGRTAKRSSPLLLALGVFQYACEQAPSARALGDSLFERFEGHSTLVIRPPVYASLHSEFVSVLRRG